MIAHQQDQIATTAQIQNKTKRVGRATIAIASALAIAEEIDGHEMST